MHGHVDELPLPAAFAKPKGRQYGYNRMHAADRVADRQHRVFGVMAVELALPIQSSGRGVRNAGKGRPVAQTALVAEAAYRAIDQPAVNSQGRLRAQTRPLHHPWPEIFNEHVGCLHQSFSEGAPVIGLEINGDIQLAAVLLHEVTAYTRPSRSEPPRDVSRRGFDLNDFGTEVAEYTAAVWASQDVAEIKDLDTVKRPPLALAHRRRIDSPVCGHNGQ